MSDCFTPVETAASNIVICVRGGGPNLTYMLLRREKFIAMFRNQSTIPHLFSPQPSLHQLSYLGSLTKTSDHYKQFLKTYI
jgi:hypothetical protein